MPIKLLKCWDISVTAEDGIISKSGISASQQRFFEFEIDPQRRRPSFDLVPAPPPGLRPLSRSPPLGLDWLLWKTAQTEPKWVIGPEICYSGNNALQWWWWWCIIWKGSLYLNSSTIILPLFKAYLWSTTTMLGTFKFILWLKWWPSW